MNKQLDDIDLKILSILMKDAKTPFTDIAKQLFVSSGTVHVRMKKMAEGLVESMGGKVEFNIVKGYPFLINDEDLTDRARQFAAEYVGSENIEDLEIWMAAEDFAFYSQETNACFYRLGTRNEANGITSSVHTSTFDIDEKALLTGVGLMSYLALCELEQ